jgi:hypothetical protein
MVPSLLKLDPTLVDAFLLMMDPLLLTVVPFLFEVDLPFSGGSIIILKVDPSFY